MKEGREGGREVRRRGGREGRRERDKFVAIMIQMRERERRTPY